MKYKIIYFNKTINEMADSRNTFINKIENYMQ